MNSTASFTRIFLMFTITFTLVSACSQRQPENHIVTAINSRPDQAPRPTENVIDKGNTSRVITEVTLTKSEILDRDFLYGSDLQYSAINDSDMELTLQSMSIGHVPAQFKIVGDTLQLVSDNSINFESDVNKPGRLITSFPIIAEDKKSLTIRIEHASPTLVTVLAGAKTPKERSSWVRSVNYVAEGNYLMFESSIEDGEGNIAEFMESVFPRSTLVSVNDKPLLADSTYEDLAERFRFLDGGEVFMDLPEAGRVRTKAAVRFKLDPAKPILWYVTPNIPDTYFDQIRTGIEGWNRYSQKMWARDMVKFAGKLPVGIKIGDPRYNVINWDSVADAGAAYESQASDPLTGIQSHSLIYLPQAWVNIGKEYWDLGEFSQKQDKIVARTKTAIAQRSFLGSGLKVNCVNDARAHIDLKARLNPEEFSKELLKGVLFHEMGHSFGLDHNFKGSLSMDTSDDTALFSTSIMDYNQYHIEKDAYDSLESEKGPLLEYDRQILSVLYNNAKDIDKAPLLPVCNDEESDSQEDGVDPLCIRYDAGKDPTKQLQDTIALATNASAKIRETQSLPLAIAELKSVLAEMKDTSDLDQVTAKLKDLATAVRGTVGFYLSSGAQSVRYLAISDVRSLYIFKKDSLPEGYDETEMRQRALSGIQFVANLEKLPDVSSAAIDALVASSKDWLAATSAIAALAPAERDAKVEELLKPMNAIKEKIEGNSDTALLTKTRARVLSEIVRVPTAPFYLGKSDQGIVDFEQSALAILEKALTSKLNKKSRAQVERAASAEALITFKDTENGQTTIQKVKDSLKTELTDANDARVRENVRSLLKTLSK